MITVHCIGPTVTAAPPVESVPAPEDPSVAVPSAVPWTVHTNRRVAPAGMSCGSGAETTVTKAGTVSGSNCKASASEPPSFVTSAEMAKVGPAGWLAGAVSDAMVRWAGVTTLTDAFAWSLTTLWSTSSVPANGSVRSSVPGALACACQMNACDAPPPMSTVSGGGCSVAGGPATIAGPAPTASADMPPEFDTVTVTATSLSTRTRAGATALAASEAGTPACTWNTPSAEPLPYGPWSVKSYMPAGSAPGTVAETVCV